MRSLAMKPGYISRRGDETDVPLRLVGQSQSSRHSDQPQSVVGIRKKLPDMSDL